MFRKGSFEDACALVERLLTADARQEIVAHALKARSLADALQRLRRGMRDDVWSVGGDRTELAPLVRAFDTATRRDGFHVLHDWDGKVDRVSDNTIPLDVLDYVARLRGDRDPDGMVLAILLDYYFLNLLALLSLRVWDEGDADARLDRVGQLLGLLQGADGCGQTFVGRVETLILIATSHFEVVEVGYDRLLQRVKSLNRPHQLHVALGHAASMGCHLRFGFEATYGRDTMVMRDDNVADYPWLCYALVTLLREYDRDETSRPLVVDALVNGFSGDARAFVGQAPSSLASAAGDQSELRERFQSRRDELAAAFEPYRPADDRYSPISFFFNFSHNVLKGMVADALMQAKPWAVSFDDLLSSASRSDADNAARQSLARTLMGYARANPDRIRGRMMPVIVYDPHAGRRAFHVMMEKLKEP